MPKLVLALAAALLAGPALGARMEAPGGFVFGPGVDTWGSGWDHTQGGALAGPGGVFTFGPGVHTWTGGADADAGSLFPTQPATTAAAPGPTAAAPPAVPLPAAAPLMLLGLGALVAAARRKDRGTAVPRTPAA